jgi:hypothetical protein
MYKKHIHTVDHGIMFILKKVIFLDFRRIVDQIHYTKFDVKLTGKIFRLWGSNDQPRWSLDHGICGKTLRYKLTFSAFKS